METTTKNRKTVRRTVKASDIPKSWQVDLPDDPEASVTVLITPAGKPENRRLVDFIGAGKGVYGTREEADAYLHNLRDEWRS
jgi:ABC-type sulfate transport system substrate-binding protein